MLSGDTIFKNNPRLLTFYSAVTFNFFMMRRRESQKRRTVLITKTITKPENELICFLTVGHFLQSKKIIPLEPFSLILCIFLLLFSLNWRKRFVFVYKIKQVIRQSDEPQRHKILSPPTKEILQFRFYVNFECSAADQPSARLISFLHSTAWEC